MKNRIKVKYAICFWSVLQCFLYAGDCVQADKYWIFFKDKPKQLSRSRGTDVYANVFKIADRSLKRRMKIYASRNLVDRRDIPVSDLYISELDQLNIAVLARSRWLNAVSVMATPAERQQIEKFLFVKKIQKVRQFKNRPVTIGASLYKTETLHFDINYRLSEIQNSLIAVPEVHAAGLTGKGVLIGVIDSGFFYRNHTCFSRVQVRDEYDFIFQDDTTSNQSQDGSSQHNHGTYVFSIIGGYDEDNLIGSAYKASYLLAKTEYVPTETRIEEDYWIEGLEWMEREGADIVTSSLGYSTFDNGDNYSYADMDGNTALTTIAADIAAAKGVTVVTSAGNERNNTWKYITSPADADSVITVGAVHQEKGIAYFSSAGPTSDGRIKPDVVAMGMGVTAADPNTFNAYQYVQGTSFAAPQVAGVCALMLEAHPSLNPMQIREALRETADRSANPDTLYGWGLVNAYDAVFYHGPIIQKVKLVRKIHPERPRLFLYLNAGNRSPETVACLYRDDQQNPFQHKIMTSLQKDGGMVYSADLDLLSEIEKLECYFSIQDSAGQFYPAPVNAPEFTYLMRASDSFPFEIEYHDTLLQTVRLYPVYPNPFNLRYSTATVQFGLHEACDISVEIINILGACVFTLLDEKVEGGGQIQIEWNGRNTAGEYVASGVYFVVLKSSNEIQVQKIVVLN